MKKYHHTRRTFRYITAIMLACVITTTQAQNDQHQAYDIDQLLAAYGINEPNDTIRYFFLVALTHHQQAGSSAKKLDHDLRLIADACNPTHEMYNETGGGTGDQSRLKRDAKMVIGGIIVGAIAVGIWSLGKSIYNAFKEKNNQNQQLQQHIQEQQEIIEDQHELVQEQTQRIVALEKQEIRLGERIKMLEKQHQTDKNTIYLLSSNHTVETPTSNGSLFSMFGSISNFMKSPITVNKPEPFKNKVKDIVEDDDLSERLRRLKEDNPKTSFKDSSQKLPKVPTHPIKTQILSNK